jgi:hypothetical protein
VWYCPPESDLFPSGRQTRTERDIQADTHWTRRVRDLVQPCRRPLLLSAARNRAWADVETFFNFLGHLTEYDDTVDPSQFYISFIWGALVASLSRRASADVSFRGHDTSVPSQRHITGKLQSDHRTERHRLARSALASFRLSYCAVTCILNRNGTVAEHRARDA